MKSIGIDLGGTKGFFGVVDENGMLCEVTKIAAPNNWDDMKTATRELVRSYQNIYDDIAGVGFGVPGLIGTDGYAYYSPNFPSLNKGVCVVDEVSELLSMPVVIDNDNNCAGYAEVRYGAAQDSRVCVSIGLGTGIGGALLIDGAIFHGAHGFAGDFGHMTIDINGPVCACSKLGCYEAIASGSALGRIAREYVQAIGCDPLLVAAGTLETITGVHVGQVAAKGDKDARAILDIYAHNIARGLASITESLDPDTIVIAGGVVELGDLLFEPLKRHFISDTQGDDSRPRPKIVPAHFGEKAGVIGAGALALAHLD